MGRSRRRSSRAAASQTEAAEQPRSGAQGRGNGAAQAQLAARTDAPFTAFDHDFTELAGQDDTERFETLAALGATTVFIPGGDYVVERPIVFDARPFLFGLTEDKPRITLKAPRGVKGATGFTFKSGARISGIDFSGGRGIDTLVQLGTTRGKGQRRNEDDADSGMNDCGFTDFDTAIRYNGRNCKINGNTFDSRREGSTDVHLSYEHIEVDRDGGRGTLPHYSHRKNSLQGNTFSDGGASTGLRLSGEVPVRGLLVNDNTKAGGGSLVKATGKGGLRDGVISGNRVSGIGTGGDPTIDIQGSNAQGLVVHGNEFGGLRRTSELFRSRSAVLDGNARHRPGNPKGKGDVHGMTVTDNTLQYAAGDGEGTAKRRERAEGSRVIDDDIVWSGNRVVDTLSDREPDRAAGSEPEADVTVGGRGKDRTQDFLDIADDRSSKVVRLAAGVHVVTEPVVFPHHVTFIGPRSAGGTKSSRPKVIFDFSELIRREGLDSRTLTGFTFESGADLKRVTFKGGMEKGDGSTTVNLLQFGKAGADNRDVAANIRNCNLGEFKGKRAITHYGTSSHIERNSFSDAPGSGTTAIELRPGQEGRRRYRNTIHQNTFHVGGSHTSVRAAGEAATRNLDMAGNVSDIGGRLLHVAGAGLDGAAITANSVSGGQGAKTHSAILDFASGEISDVDVAGNTFAGLDLDTPWAKWSESRLDNDRYAKDPYEDADRPGHIVQVGEAAQLGKQGLDIWGNSLAFARHGQDAVSVAGRKNQRRTRVDANVIRNSARRKKANRTGNGGVSAGVRQTTNNVGSGKKNYPNR